MRNIASFLEELKRRNIYRVAVVYSLSALAVVEAAEVVVPRLGFSDQIVTYILILALLGLPVALFIGWLSQTGEHGSSDFVIDHSIPGSATKKLYLMAFGAIMVVLAFGWWLIFGRPPSGIVTSEFSPRSVAVLPFRDMSPAKDQTWFGEGLAEEILTALSRIPDLHIVTRQSSFPMAEASVEEIGDQLSVTHILTGSVRAENDLASINAELIDVNKQKKIWSRSFKPKLSNVLEVQEEIAKAVTQSLQIELGPLGESKLIRSSTDNPEAYEHYLRGLQLWNRRSEAEILSAIDHFRESVQLDSAYAAAWAGLALAYLVLPEYSPVANVKVIRDLSIQSAKNALAIEPNQADGLTALGWGEMIHHYNWVEAEQLIGRALSLDPFNINALHWQSHVLSWQGRSEEALDLAIKAVELDPVSAVIRQNLAFILMEARQYDKALEEMNRVESQETNYNVNHLHKWSLFCRTGEFGKAAEELKTYLLQIGRSATEVEGLAIQFKASAQTFRDSRITKPFDRDMVDKVQPGLEIAGQLYAVAGDTEATLEMLDRAYVESAGARNLLSIKINPLYDFLRDDPRFGDILSRIGLKD